MEAETSHQDCREYEGLIREEELECEREEELCRGIFENIVGDFEGIVKFASTCGVRMVSPDEFFLFGKLKDIRIPGMRSVHIGRQKYKIKDFCMLFRYSFPNKTSRFTLSYGWLIPFPRYFVDFIRIAPRIEHTVTLQDLIINRKQLKRLFAALKHLRLLQLMRVKFSVPEIPDFSMALRNTKLEEFNFTRCGQPNRGNWKKNINEFVNLIKGFSTSDDLKKSLKLISVTGCGLDEIFSKKLLKDHDLGHVKIKL
ncbi:unnamed protein product [Moneuplotes crassus]|uniref:Uncharacterized protein n=1 Tax=Euplotes crassus TaxID=5936 RepID=A0AAD2D3E8_EUPCR|nr:unnamed protein product [Moneuplotes crassus]